MPSIHYDVWRRGGVAATFELLRDGYTSHDLTAAVRAGMIVRARQGHYVIPELDPGEIAAVRVGGRLTGLAGLRRHGVWTPTRTSLCVAVISHARGLRSPHDHSVKLTTLERPGLIVVWVPTREPGTRSLVGVVGCLLEVARSQPARVAFASIESALSLGRLTVHEWRRAARSLPRDRRRRLARVNRLSGSGGESLASFGLLEAGIGFRQQVTIEGVGRVDFLIGERLVVEIDGAQFHTSKSSFEEDRRRDAQLSILGYRVLRFSYAQVSDRWGVVLAAIVAAISRGDHLP